MDWLRGERHADCATAAHPETPRSPTSREDFDETRTDHCCRMCPACGTRIGPILAPRPRPRRGSSGLPRHDAGIATGAAIGSGVIGMTAQEVEAETGMGAGVITAGTNVVQAFCSRAEIHASRCDVTRTSPCEPASTQQQRCWTGSALCRLLGRARRRQPHRAQVPLRRPPRTLAQGLLQRLRQAPAQERRLHDLLLGKLLCCSDVR